MISGIATGCVLIVSFVWTLPDGKLHIFFCNVGQGDGAYIRFPDGRDMVVDGGPNDSILHCLGKHMPFWDRHITFVAMTHPQKDHMQGLVSVFERFTVDYFVRSDIDATTEGYKKFVDVIGRKKISEKFTVAGDHITVGATTLSFLWPSEEQIAKRGNSTRRPLAGQGDALKNQENVLGSSVGELNDYSLVFFLRYGSFDAVFTGDADSHVEPHYTGSLLPDDQLELLKVPHHGSKTGMTQAFIDWLHPKLAVISVGKNNYGHPTDEALQLLRSVGANVFRTDQDGTIEVTSDGTHWRVKGEKKVGD